MQTHHWHWQVLLQKNADDTDFQHWTSSNSNTDLQHLEVLLELCVSWTRWMPEPHQVPSSCSGPAHSHCAASSACFPCWYWRILWYCSRTLHFYTTKIEAQFKSFSFKTEVQDVNGTTPPPFWTFTTLSRLSWQVECRIVNHLNSEFVFTTWKLLFSNALRSISGLKLTLALEQ